MNIQDWFPLGRDNKRNTLKKIPGIMPLNTEEQRCNNAKKILQKMMKLRGLPITDNKTYYKVSHLKTG